MLFVGDFTVKNGPTCCTKVIPTVSEHRKAGMCLMEKRHLSHEFCFGMSYSAVDHTFVVNELTIVVVQSLSHVHSLRPHRLQHARLHCPSLSAGVCSNSCPLSW